ncbi:MAG: transglycosylase SLT domain-containing protein [Bdellovibrionales bacterium]|nr:transglycosylase SLT domain-containing protein [Bdellovibrionales bacterium]
MNLVHLTSALKLYLEAALLLAIVAAILACLRVCLFRWPRAMRFSGAVALANLMLVLALTFPLVLSAVPKESLIRPAAQTWSGSIKGQMPALRITFPISTSAQSAQGPEGVELGYSVVLLVVAVLFLGGLLAHVRLWLRLKALSRAIAGYPVLRSIGRVRIRAAEGGGAPFAAHVSGRAEVVLPADIIERPEPMRIALRHELQHHRARDTGWLYLHESIRAAFFWSPAVPILIRTIQEFQEFACDEALIGRRGISPRAYGRCLIEAAESALRPRFVAAGTAGMSVGTRGDHLKRRIEMLFEHKGRKSVASTGIGVAVVALGALATVAFAAKSAVQDRSLTRSEAERFAAIASKGARVPLDVNEQVLARLNRLAGTPEGRRTVRDARSRLPRYQTMFEAAASRHGMPLELVAVAMFESGLRNDAVSPPPYRAAGLWQFIPETARSYGLVVDGTRDERKDPELATDAAMRYLKNLHERFGDWRLAMKAYNEGERRVERLMKEHGTRDPWALERVSSTAGYLAGAVAMMIVLKNPELTESFEAPGASVLWKAEDRRQELPRPRMARATEGEEEPAIRTVPN